MTKKVVNSSSKAQEQFLNYEDQLMAYLSTEQYVYFLLKQQHHQVLPIDALDKMWSLFSFGHK